MATMKVSDAIKVYENPNRFSDLDVNNAILSLADSGLRSMTGLFYTRKDQVESLVCVMIERGYSDFQPPIPEQLAAIAAKL